MFKYIFVIYNKDIIFLATIAMSFFIQRKNNRFDFFIIETICTDSIFHWFSFSFKSLIHSS